MRPSIFVGLALLVVAAPAGAAERLQFWNLTANTVEADEKLPLKGVDAGHYDVKLTDVTGRTCLVKNVTVRATGKYAFSIAEKDLTDCKK